MSAYIELCRSDDDYALSKLAEAANAAANNGNKICYIKHEGPTSSIVDFRDIEAVAVLKNGLPVAIFSEETFCLNLVVVKNGKLHLTDKMVGGVVETTRVRRVILSMPLPSTIIPSRSLWSSVGSLMTVPASQPTGCYNQLYKIEKEKTL